MTHPLHLTPQELTPSTQTVLGAHDVAAGPTETGPGAVVMRFLACARAVPWLRRSSSIADTIFPLAETSGSRVLMQVGLGVSDVTWLRARGGF